MLPSVRAYYAKPGNFNGGSLHIVLNDLNVSDDNVRFCIEWARQHCDEDGIHLGEALLLMSRTQRGKLARIKSR